MPVGQPLIQQIGITNYARSCRDRGDSLTDAYVKSFGVMPRKLRADGVVSVVPHRRVGERQ